MLWGHGGEPKSYVSRVRRIQHAVGPSWFTARLRLGLEVQSRVRQRIAYKRSLGSDSADGSIVGKAAERSVICSASDRWTHSNSQEGSYSVQQTVTKEHHTSVTCSLYTGADLATTVGFPLGTPTVHRSLPWALHVPSVHHAAAKPASPNLTAEPSLEAAHW